MKRNLLLLLLVGFVIAGSGCTIFDAFLIAVNIEGISGRYKINPDPSPTYSVWKTFLAQDYLNPDFSDDIKNVSIYDVTVQTEDTIGTFTGNVNGVVTAQYGGMPEQTILEYQGPWSAFQTPQSMMQALQNNNPNITPIPGAIGVLINAILAKADITLCASGTMSQAPIPDGLYVTLVVLGQVIVEPD